MFPWFGLAGPATRLRTLRKCNFQSLPQHASMKQGICHLRSFPGNDFPFGRVRAWQEPSARTSEVAPRRRARRRSIANHPRRPLFRRSRVVRVRRSAPAAVGSQGGVIRPWQETGREPFLARFARGTRTPFAARSSALPSPAQLGLALRPWRAGPRPISLTARRLRSNFRGFVQKRAGDSVY
jgi:hypothetical protein